MRIAANAASPTSDAAIEELIGPGETIAWVGKPGSLFLWRQSDWIAEPFYILWLAFAVFIFRGAQMSWGQPIVFTLVPALFVAVGLYLTVGRFFWNAFSRSRTTYAVTDRAAYIIRTGPLGGVRRLTGTALDQVRLEAGRGGSGSIVFGPPDWQNLFAPRYASRTNAPAFEALPNAKGIYDLILGIRP